MPAHDTIRIEAVADFAAAAYCDDAAGALHPRDVLSVAAEVVDRPRPARRLDPALLARLEAMTEDYARILARLDRIAAEDAGRRALRPRSLRTVN